MTAEGDGLPLLVAAIGIAAIASFQVRQRDVARINLDTAKRDPLDWFEDGATPEKLPRPEIVGGRRP